MLRRYICLTDISFYCVYKGPIKECTGLCVSEKTLTCKYLFEADKWRCVSILDDVKHILLKCTVVTL